MTRVLRFVVTTILGITLGASGAKSDQDHSKHDHGAAPQGSSSGSVPAQPPSGEAAIINTKCPIMGEDIDPAVSVAYKGQRVAFCCKECIEEWGKLDDAKKAEKVGR